MEPSYGAAGRCGDLPPLHLSCSAPCSSYWLTLPSLRLSYLDITNVIFKSSILRFLRDIHQDRHLKFHIPLTVCYLGVFGIVVYS